MIKKTTSCSSPTPPETEINMTTRQYGASPEMRRKTRSFHSLKVLFLIFHSFKRFFCYLHSLLISLFISICFESLLNVGKHAEAYVKAYIEASGSQEVLAMGRQDEARLACKGGIPLLLYEAPISPERWRTSPRHVRKYGYAAQPAWQVRILCCTTSTYIPSDCQM